MKFLYIFLLTLLVLNGCASKKPSNTPDKALIKEEVRTTIKTYKDDVESCYENYLKVKPTAQGKMFIDWSISESGNVSEIKLKENPFEDETVLTVLLII